MSNDKPFAELLQEVDVALAERRHLRQRGVHLIVTHLDHIPGTLCSAGEMIGDIALSAYPELVSLGLTHMSHLLMDCFCRYRMPLTAMRIEEIMNTDPFYVNYAANQVGRNEVIARPDRNTTRVYVWRVRKQMEKMFRELGLNLNPEHILASEKADANIFVYRLRATTEFLHVNRHLRESS
jgi:hypothetical protein